MNQEPSIDTPMQATRKCPFCAENILAEAVKCRFCQSMLIDENGKPLSAPAPQQKTPSNPPSLLWLLFLTLLCPGYGAIKLGRRGRGWLILGGVILAMLLWTMDAVPIVQEIVKKTVSMKIGEAYAIRELTEKLQSGVWYHLFYYLYLYSFVDLLLIYPWSSGSKPDQKPKNPVA